MQNLMGAMGNVPKQPQPGVDIREYDGRGHLIFSASIPMLVARSFHDVRVACAAGSLYVAARIWGGSFRDDVVESAVYRVPLPAER